jgi:hypothetical protein
LTDERLTLRRAVRHHSIMKLSHGAACSGFAERWDQRVYRTRKTCQE